MTTLADLLALAEAATPGEWGVVSNGEWDEGDQRTDTYKVVGPRYIEVPGDGYYIPLADARLMAIGPEVIKALVAVAEAAEAWMSGEQGLPFVTVGDRDIND